MRLSLIPKPSEFFDLFVEAGSNASEAARSLETRLQEFPNSNIAHADIKAIEHKGDGLTRDIIQLLNTQYVTPFDREDIYDLAEAIDDVVDLIEEASDFLDLYNIETMEDKAIEQCSVLAAAADELAKALANLKGLKGLRTILAELHRLEDEGDQVARTAIAGLFHNSHFDPLLVIRWKDIFEALEGALDACETAATVIENIVVKNA